MPTAAAPGCSTCHAQIDTQLLPDADDGTLHLKDLFHNSTFPGETFTTIMLHSSVVEQRVLCNLSMHFCLVYRVCLLYTVRSAFSCHTLDKSHLQLFLAICIQAYVGIHAKVTTWASFLLQ